MEDDLDASKDEKKWKSSDASPGGSKKSPFSFMGLGRKRQATSSSPSAAGGGGGGGGGSSPPTTPKSSVGEDVAAPSPDKDLSSSPSKKTPLPLRKLVAGGGAASPVPKRGLSSQRLTERISSSAALRDLTLSSSNNNNNNNSNNNSNGSLLAASAGDTSSLLPFTGARNEARFLCTVLEGRSLSATRPYVVLCVEGSTYVVPPLDGPDPLWAVPPREDDPHPNRNHFECPVRNFVQGCLHVMLFDAASTQSTTPIACGMVPLNRLLYFGYSAGEVNAWLLLTQPQHVYWPTAETLEALDLTLRPKEGEKPNPEFVPDISGYIQLRLQVRVEGHVYRSILFDAPIVDKVPTIIDEQVSSIRSKEESAFEWLARARLLFSFVYASKSFYRTGLFGLLLVLYHLCFWAPGWEYPLLLLLVLPFGVTVRNILTIRRQKRVPANTLVSVQDRVQTSQVGKQTEPVKRLLSLTDRVLGLVCPLGEKLQNSFLLVSEEITLVICAGCVLLGVTLTLLLLMLPDNVAVFLVGLVTMAPPIAGIIGESIYGKSLSVYDLTVYQARDLDAFDVTGTSDPYLKIDEFRDINDEKICTQVIKRTLSPVWNRTFRIAMKKKFDYGIKTVSMSMFDEDIGKADDYMGRIEFTKSDFDEHPIRWFPLVDGKGEVQLGLSYVGSTFEKVRNTPNPFVREWPLVKKLLGKLPGASLLSPFRNVVAKIPDYVVASRFLYSSVTFFVDTHSILPKPKYAKSKMN